MRTYTHNLLTLLFASSTLFSGALASAEAPASGVALSDGDRAKSAMCTDGKSHYVIIAPNEHVSHQLYYGDGKKMSEVRSDTGGMTSGTDFLDPRFFNPTANDNFRGLDFRVISSVEYDADKKSCSLRCGERKQDLSIVPAGDAQKMMSSATFQKSPNTREPYAFARDDHGIYYYVDRGNTQETKNNFRVFVGKKGALKLQKMKDVASDSEGEVFSTATGDLRFVTSHDQRSYSWMQAGKAVKLVALQPRDNLNLIYTTLGVYTGQKLGTPCDDM